MLYHLLRTVVPLLMLILWNICAAEREIYVSPSGNDSSLCTKDVPCTIDKGLSLASELNSTRIILAKGNYTMKDSHNFTSMTSFSLFGNGSNRDDVRITCNANVSLSFTLSENISFEGIKLRKCGGWHQSAVGMKKHYPDLQSAKFKTALDFRYCKNLQISNVEISFSPGLGANLYDVGGFVNFIDSLFADNKASLDSRSDEAREWEPHAEYVYSGGGVFILLTRYGFNTVNVTPSKHNSYQHDNQYLFTNCHFLRNEARWSRNSEYKDLNTPELPFSSGGGMAVYFRGNASRCKVAIQACKFIDNQASWGGGLQIETKDKTENNSFVIEGTMFLRNYAHLAGGGARIGNTPEKDAQLILNQFHVTNCTFENNVAVWGGGGASIFGTTIPRKCEKHTDPDVTQFYFNGCIWQHNKGNVGAAMGLYLYNYNVDQIGPQIPYRVSFDNDSLFESNVVHVLKRDLTIGQGALYSMEVPLIFKNTTKFLNNSKSALVLDGSTLAVHDQLEFSNNTGFRGGAIAMYGRSRIIFHENSNLTFDGNLCEDRGGAMYIQAPGPPMVSFNATGTNIYTCFFSYFKSSVDYNKWNTTVIFKDNKSPKNSTGNSVYVTTLKSCWQAGENRKNNSVLRWKFVKFRNLPKNFTNISGEVATDPVDIQLVKSDWEVAPGEVFNATVKLFDEVWNLVPGIVDIVIKSPAVGLKNPSSLYLTTGNITNITLHGREGSRFDVELNCIGSRLLGKVILDVNLQPCYAGFRFSNTTNMCECMNSKSFPKLKQQARGISRCTSDGKGLLVKEGYWAGEVDGTFSTYICPYGYCNSSDFGSNEYRYVKDHVCNQGRNQSSILCGQCDGTHTITVGSEECKNDCTYWDLFLLIPFGVVLLLVVMGIMLIDLDVFTGYLNAWLYSYQVMKLLAPDGFQFNHFSEFLIGLTNMQIKVGGRSFCLAKDWDDADKLMVMYAMPVYVIIIVVLLAKMIGAFPDWCFSKRVRAPFRGICTILVLCYTDITYISLRILRYANFGSKTVLFVNGDIEYFSGKHLYYGIVAIFFIVVFVLPFPIFLLFRPFLTNRLRPLLNLNRWNPFFDALQSCFKDQYRWCAAFYFVCRLAILVIYTFMPASPAKRLLLEGCCILILLIFAVLRPYKEARDVKEDEESYHWMYISDVVLLTTLSFIAVVSSPIDNSCATTKGVKIGFKIFLNVLSCVPVAVLLVIACFVARKYLPSCKVTLDEETEPIMSQTSVSSRPPSISETPETSEMRHNSRGSRSCRRPQTPSSHYGSIDRHTS